MFSKRLPMARWKLLSSDIAGAPRAESTRYRPGLRGLAVGRCPRGSSLLDPRALARYPGDSSQETSEASAATGARPGLAPGEVPIHRIAMGRSEERRVGKECRSR